jgi:UDP-N-acetylglucosamine acyltransferase
MPIHPTAIVSSEAQIHEAADIGPYVVVDGPVRIGARTRVLPYVHLSGDTVIGEDNIIHMGCVIGYEPQDLGYKGESRRLEIGNGNVFREHVTIHRASKADTVTRIGDQCFLMVNCHVGHDCQIGNRVIIANNTMLAGHVVLHDGANISGGCAIHQFTRIGRFVMMQGMSGIGKDVPPFLVALGVNRIGGINVIGLRRAGFTAEARSQIKTAHRILYREGNSVAVALEKLKAGGFGPEVAEMIAFIEGSRRGICRRLLREASDDDDE